MKLPHRAALDRFSGWVENKAYRAVAKYGQVPVGTGSNLVYGETEPPYQRRVDPRWIYRVRHNGSLVNNAIEEKVNQTFRRGWGDWEKRYEAKCPECHEQFGSDTPFIEDYHPDDVEIDFDAERECPNCEQMVHMITPDPAMRKKAEQFLTQANGGSLSGEDLEPDEANSVGQSLLGVLRETSFDIESFDDGWLVLERQYKVSPDGRIQNYEPEGVYRAPPEKMRYSMDKETGEFGGQYWVCIECRERAESYIPEETPNPCSDCGNKTYEVFAVATEDIHGNDPIRYYIRGEFMHRSLYEPSKFYGYSPVISLWEETRSLEKMDEWYKDAYEYRRAPRGAIALKSSNAQSAMDWNKKQFEKMKNDPNHIPTLIDDGESAAEPIKFVTLLESPAEMQQMEMREWFKERISAKWGVTPIFQGSPSESGLSQSLEIQVSNRAADRLRTVVNEGFIEPLLLQLGVEGWTIGVAPVEEENEQAEAELMLKHMNLMQQAAQLGLEPEWTEDDRARIPPGEAEPQEQMGEEQGMGGMDGLGEMMSDSEETAADQGGPEDQDDVQTATEAAGGDRVDLGTTEGAGGMSPEDDR